MLLTAKVMLRKLYGRNYDGGWDDPLPAALEWEWEAYLTMMLHSEEVVVPRALFSAEAPSLWLIAFWDGSLDAHAVVIYS